MSRPGVLSAMRSFCNFTPILENPRRSNETIFQHVSNPVCAARNIRGVHGIPDESTSVGDGSPSGHFSREQPAHVAFATHAPAVALERSNPRRPFSSEDTMDRECVGSSTNAVGIMDSRDGEWRTVAATAWRVNQPHGASW